MRWLLGTFCATSLALLWPTFADAQQVKSSYDNIIDLSAERWMCLVQQARELREEKSPFILVTVSKRLCANKKNTLLPPVGTKRGKPGPARVDETTKPVTFTLLPEHVRCLATRYAQVKPVKKRVLVELTRLCS